MLNCWNNQVLTTIDCDPLLLKPVHFCSSNSWLFGSRAVKGTTKLMVSNHSDLFSFVIICVWLFKRKGALVYSRRETPKSRDTGARRRRFIPFFPPILENLHMYTNLLNTCECDYWLHREPKEAVTLGQKVGFPPRCCCKFLILQWPAILRSPTSFLNSNSVQ